MVCEVPQGSLIFGLSGLLVIVGGTVRGEENRECRGEGKGRSKLKNRHKSTAIPLSSEVLSQQMVDTYIVMMHPMGNLLKLSFKTYYNSSPTSLNC